MSTTIDGFRKIVENVRANNPELSGDSLRKELRKHKPYWIVAGWHKKAWQQAVSEVCGKQRKSVSSAMTAGQKKAAELSNQGKSVREIARVMNRSETAVRGYLYGASLRGETDDKRQETLCL